MRVRNPRNGTVVGLDQDEWAETSPSGLDVPSSDGRIQVSHSREGAAQLQSFVYDLDRPADIMFGRLGELLSGSGELFRHPEPAAGLVRVVGGEGPREIRVTTPTELLAAITDRVRVTVVAGGRPRVGRIPAPDLGAMLRSDAFLDRFRPLDRLISYPMYTLDWEMTVPGYNTGGCGQRFYQAGLPVVIHAQSETIRRFLDVLPFKSQADRTNAAAAALTVLLRNHWPGSKPCFPVTANRSHAGKGTVISFISGRFEPEEVTFTSTDWAFENAIVSLLKNHPGAAVLNVDNVRLGRNTDAIRSSFLERFLHEPVPVLYSPGSRTPYRMPNHVVVTMTANVGVFSDDLINRAVPIRLEAFGDLARRPAPLGDPKREFLPRHRDRIAGELYGMIENWKAAGRPRDAEARHPSFADWAATVGGILKVNGFSDFLANMSERRTCDDPVRRALALLGATYPDEWATAADWAARMATHGLTRVLIAPADRETPDGRRRGAGVVLSDHACENLRHSEDDLTATSIVRKSRRRFEGRSPETRYCFEQVEVSRTGPVE